MSTEKDQNKALNKTDVSYSDFMEQQGYDEGQIFADYQKALEEENKKQEENSREVLSKIKPNVTEEYFNAINHFLHDTENGIWGDLKIVEKTIGEWQDEYQDEEDETNYWDILKGMYVNQSCGYSGDDYNGTLEIKIHDNKFLRCSFSL